VETSFRIDGYPGLSMLFLHSRRCGWLLASDQHLRAGPETTQENDERPALSRLAPDK
jgi:hypothetical protein